MGSTGLPTWRRWAASGTWPMSRNSSGCGTRGTAADGAFEAHRRLRHHRPFGVSRGQMPRPTFSPLRPREDGWISNPSPQLPRQRIRSEARGRTVVAIAIVGSVAAACADTLEPDPQGERMRPNVSFSVTPDTQGVLGAAQLRAEVTDESGSPLVGWVVEWRSVSGGLLGNRGDHSRPIEEQAQLQPRAKVPTGADGLAWTQLRLGGAVGTQFVEASVPGSDTVQVSVEGLPGAVFVGVFNPQFAGVDELPSDTIRLHASHLPYVGEAEAMLGSGSVVRIYGAIMPGPGLDEAWPFHLDPETLGPVPTESIGVNCVSTPPATRDAAEALQGTLGFRLCPYLLNLIAVEEVPEWYLEDLAGRDG